jgi:predicted DNA-binding protein
VVHDRYAWDERSHDAVAASGLGWHDRRRRGVHSVRLDPDLSEQLEAEATRRGINPSALMRELVELGLRQLAEDTQVTVRIGDLHRVLDQALRRAA